MHRLSGGTYPYIVLGLFDRYECYAERIQFFLENQSQGVIISGQGLANSRPVCGAKLMVIALRSSQKHFCAKFFF